MNATQIHLLPFDGPQDSEPCGLFTDDSTSPIATGTWTWCEGERRRIIRGEETGYQLDSPSEGRTYVPARGPLG